MEENNQYLKIISNKQELETEIDRLLGRTAKSIKNADVIEIVKQVLAKNYPDKTFPTITSS